MCVSLMCCRGQWMTVGESLVTQLLVEKDSGCCSCLCCCELAKMKSQPHNQSGIAGKI